tara:strand:+ start:93 stop:218 length:126 start_codon:yes stop_codon:yes gene_type:complete
MFGLFRATVHSLTLAVGAGSAMAQDFDQGLATAFFRTMLRL